MKERPILFSGPMARAILEGRKTQTRRVVKPQPPNNEVIGPELYHPEVSLRTGELVPGPRVFGIYDSMGDWGIVCPYGQPGDRLWVRETWAPAALLHQKAIVCYRADGDVPNADTSRDIILEDKDSLICAHRALEKGHWIPSIHMPRELSRITLEVVSVRVERLLKISESDAIAEGAKRNDAPGEEWDGTYLTQRYIDGVEGAQDDEPHGDAREWYRDLWESINGKGSWDANPWVWVVEFKRLEVAS